MELPKPEELLVNGKLYTLSYWSSISLEDRDYTRQEKQQLQSLYDQYRMFYNARESKQDLRKMQKVLTIADRIGATIHK